MINKKKQISDTVKNPNYKVNKTLKKKWRTERSEVRHKLPKATSK